MEGRIYPVSVLTVFNQPLIQDEFKRFSEAVNITTDILVQGVDVGVFLRVQSIGNRQRRMGGFSVQKDVGY